MTPQVGDWIRFMCGGRLVIDEVAYIVQRASWDSTPELITVAHGRVRYDDVLECRAKQAVSDEPCN